MERESRDLRWGRRWREINENRREDRHTERGGGDPCLNEKNSPLYFFVFKISLV